MKFTGLRFEFFREGEGCTIHHCSTDAVIPRNSKNADEDINIEDVQGKLVDGYAQTKWVAERLVVNSQLRGLPTIIYRLGMLIYDNLRNQLGQKSYVIKLWLF